MKHCLIALALTAFTLQSCRNGSHVKAEIFERKKLAGNHLMIYYRYDFKNKIYTDSALIANNIIAKDSIYILIDPLNPSSTTPQLSK